MNIIYRGLCVVLNGTMQEKMLFLFGIVSLYRVITLLARQVEVLAGTWFFV